MRASSALRGLRADARGSAAPFAVVAVVVMLGAGIAYVYMESYQVAMEEASEREAATGVPDAVMADAVAWVEDAVDAALGLALDTGETMPSGTIVSWLGTRASTHLSNWAVSAFPWDERGCRVDIEEPRLWCVPVHATVVAGNALGQQVPQTLPVGVQAVAACTLTVASPGGIVLAREVTARAERVAPQVLAAHMQNELEYALSEDGLVGALVADAAWANMVCDPAWTAQAGEQECVLLDAVRTVEWSLFGSRPSDTVPTDITIPSDGGREVRGGDLGVRPGTGRVTVQLPSDANITFVFPPTGEVVRVRLVPGVASIDYLGVDCSMSNYSAAEAAGHGDASAVRVTYGISFEHTVDCLLEGGRASTVGRTIEARASTMTWTWDRAVGADPFRDPQVEDWGLFESAMTAAGSVPVAVTLNAGGTDGAAVSIALDGVYLGDYDARTITLPNVQAGRHQLSLWTRDGVSLAAACATEVMVPSGHVAIVQAELSPTGADEGALGFWYSLMASYHTDTGSRIPYLEHIAAMVGYPPAPDEVATDPLGNMDRLIYWEEGLGVYLDRLTEAWTSSTGPISGDVLGAMKDVHSIYKLTHKVLYKLPKDALKGVQKVIYEIDGETGTEVSAWLETTAGKLPLFTAKQRLEGLVVAFQGTNPRTFLFIKTMPAFLAVASSVLKVRTDTLELVKAVHEGDLNGITLATLNLTFDLAGMALSVVGLMRSAGWLELTPAMSSTLTIVSAALTVVTSFYSAYKDAGDVWGALGLLARPDSFSDAMRTAAFAQGIAVLVATVIVSQISGIALAAAMAMATGVGAIVFLAVLAVWAAFHWDDIRSWFASWVSGTAKDEEVRAADEGITGMLGSTMRLRAGLNAVDVEGELLQARLERGKGLALMEARSMLPDAAAVDGLGRADLRQLDGGGVQARRAKAVAEARYWVEVLWREVDDFVDADGLAADGRPSEGFRNDNDKALGAEHDFWTELWVLRAGGGGERIAQADGRLAAFLASLNSTNVDGWELDLSIKGRVYGPALDDLTRELGAVASELGRCVDRLSACSREAAYAAMQGSAPDYRRDMSVVEVRLGESVRNATIKLMVDMDPGSVKTVAVEAGTAVATVRPGEVRSILFNVPGGYEVATEVVSGRARNWSDPMFATDVLDHKVVPADGD
jgi:hypothetical protein